ncbi:polysaccharide deacetylase family protein (plasmid) [Microvirga sp. RSM25]|uniref:polysaccharide deacetylase family protein n=1 Tax=Microvirga sp. RSM25 TaxID=3273802 RepID=UPI0038501167
MKHLNYISKMSCECADGTGSRSVHLTFDDDPNPIFTPQILDMLAKHRAPATFFVIDAYAAKNLELVRRLIAEMPAVGNHTMTYPVRGSVRVQREILAADGAIGMACSPASVRYSRAQYGTWTEEVVSASTMASTIGLSKELAAFDMVGELQLFSRTATTEPESAGKSLLPPTVSRGTHRIVPQEWKKRSFRWHPSTL